MQEKGGPQSHDRRAVPPGHAGEGDLTRTEKPPPNIKQENAPHRYLPAHLKAVFHDRWQPCRLLQIALQRKFEGKQINRKDATRARRKSQFQLLRDVYYFGPEEGTVLRTLGVYLHGSDLPGTIHSAFLMRLFTLLPINLLDPNRNNWRRKRHLHDPTSNRHYLDPIHLGQVYHRGIQ